MINNLRSYKKAYPELGDDVYVDPQACVIGDVALGDDVSVWPMTVIRGDVSNIRIGPRSNIQDGSVLHVTHDGPFTKGERPLLIGEEVTVGHRVILHACTVGNRCLIGMGSIVMDDVIIEDHVLLAAGSVVPPKKRLLSKSLYKGNPAIRVRDLSEQEIDMLAYSAKHYVNLKNEFMKESV